MRFWRRVKFLFQFRKSFPFFKEFFQTDQVTRTSKIASVILIVGYIVFPFDLIPDFLLFFGIVDDVMLATLILQQMVKMAPVSLREKYDL